MGEMIEVRWHGIGGMGSVTSSELYANAAINEGKYAQSFPSYGTERRGAPVVAYLRISEDFIRIRTIIDKPDIVTVLSPGLLYQIDVMKGLKENGKIIINSSKSPEELKSEFGFKCPVASVNASKIALETIKLPITNTAMMGALEKVTEIVKMESLIDQLRARFGKKADVNIEAMTKAYNETVMEA